MNQLCKVCGEPAAGFHFGAFTCEGCKSFFGRTYNNLSQIHECKNGGVCIINKQNRTSCKACRLRKCLFVGMSKSGSRYGRRSNWFKIHCLLQEQASFATQPPSFRTPATPTLQDGSLPFVATQLRDPSMSHNTEVSSSSTPIPLSSHSPISRIGVSIGSLSPQLAPTYPTSLLTPDRRLHETSLLAQRPPHFPASLEGTYREHLLNLIQRSQGIESLRTHVDLDPLEDTRSSDLALAPTPFANWERRIKEATRRHQIDSQLKSCSPKDIKIETIQPHTMHEDKLEECRTQEASSPHNKEPLEKEEIRSNISSPKHDRDVNENKMCEPKEEHEPLMTGEERLAFLKSATSISSSYRHNSPLRFPANNDLMYSPLNNNIFSLPPYPPMWPSIIPFSPFSKLYPQFCPPPVPTFNTPKTPFPQFQPQAQADCSPPSIPCKEDPIKKKRFLDAILQVQQERRSPVAGSPLSSPTRPSSIPATSQQPIVRSVSTTSTDQPMDLTVRRKRKMDKSDIVYKPCDDVEDMDSDMCRLHPSAPIDVRLTQLSLPSPTTSEVPLKFIKLDSTSETLAV